MTQHRTFRARPLRAVAALAIVAASLLAAAPSASATDNACNYDNITFNACLRFDYADYFWWHAHAGIDVYLPEQYGREIVACGANFQASLWGDDGANDQFIRDLVIKPGWPAAGPTGIGAEFDAQYLHGSDLDEDDGEDELYARISYFDCHTGLTRNFVTGTIRGDFRA
jgi:hypothetical protein